VEEVSTIGVGVTADVFCKSGDFGVTIQPRDGKGEVVISSDLQVTCTASTQGAGSIACDVTAVECTPGSAASGRRTVALAIIDDSGSMAGSDPSEERKKACVEFVSSLGADDAVAISDYGPSPTEGGKATSTTDLRVLEDFTTDKAKAAAACEKIVASGGTPLYESVEQGVEKLLVSARKVYGDANYILLLLSDGMPTGALPKQDAIGAAQAEGIPVYTVGLGPAAEGGTIETPFQCTADADCTAIAGAGASCKPAAAGGANVCHVPSTDPGAVQVLQELASETSGAYAAATDATALEQLFRNVSSAAVEGKCTVSARLDLSATTVSQGEKIEGTLEVGKGKASTTYGFTVPVPDDPTAALCKP
jgi:hypothetical protein